MRAFTRSPSRGWHARFAAVLLGLALTSAPAWAGMTITGKPKVEFLILGNLVNIPGVTQSITVVDDGTNLTFTVPIDTVTTGTGMWLRDSRIKQYHAETAKYPDAVLTLAKSAVTWPASGDAKGTTTAKFTAHGTTIDVPVEFTIKKAKTGWKVDAGFPFDVLAVGMTEPMSYMGVNFENLVNVKVSLEMVDVP